MSLKYVMSDTSPTQSPRKLATKAAQMRLAEGAKTIQAETVAKTKGKVGQPTKFTPELWAEVINRIACCENIIDICNEPDMPSYYTIRKWYQGDPLLKADMEKAWEDASYLSHAVNDNILRGGIMSTGDFRRDEALVANNRWFMGKTSKRLFGDKTTVDLNSTINIAVPNWANATPVQEVLEGEYTDPDRLYERETVQRIAAEEAAKEPQDDTLPDVSATQVAAEQ